jgi:hypothetical protein
MCGLATLSLNSALATNVRSSIVNDTAILVETKTTNLFWAQRGALRDDDGGVEYTRGMISQ